MLLILLHVAVEKKNGGGGWREGDLNPFAPEPNIFTVH